MKRRTLTGLLALLAAAAVLTTSGCSKKAESSGSSIEAMTTAPSQPQTTTEAAAEEETLDAETMDLIKYNIYVQLNNYMVEVLDSLYSYYIVVENAEEFALIPDSGYSYKFDISPFNSDIIDDALAVASMEPAYETLDDLTLQIAEPMRALMDTFDSIYSCYDFADNQYAKAKEFHASVQANASAFEELAYQYMDQITSIGNERVKISEQKLLDEGKTITYNASHMITVANQLLDECYRQGVNDANIIELDLTSIRPLYEELVNTVTAFNEATSDNNQLMKESLANSSPMYGLPDSLVQSVEWMIKQVESQTPIPDPGSEYLGGLIHIQEVLSKCIEQYNTVFAE